MIPRIIHQFSGTAGTKTNVVPDYLGPESAGILLPNFILDSAGRMIKGADLIITGLVAIPASYYRVYSLRATITADVTHVDYANRIGFMINYDTALGKFWASFCEENNASNCDVNLSFWNGSAREQLSSGGGLNMYFGTYQLVMCLIERGDYLYALNMASNRAPYSCRSFMASRYQKTITKFGITAGWDTPEWAHITDFSVIDMPIVI